MERQLRSFALVFILTAAVLVASPDSTPKPPTLGLLQASAPATDLRAAVGDLAAQLGVPVDDATLSALDSAGARLVPEARQVLVEELNAATTSAALHGQALAPLSLAQRA